MYALLLGVYGVQGIRSHRGRARPMSAERLVGVFAREADFLVEPNSQTTSGVWLSSGPVKFLPRTSPPVELGAAVRAALRESQQGVTHPTDWKKFVPPILQVAGVRSWAALQRS